jgi:hypothetical protein
MKHSHITYIIAIAVVASLSLAASPTHQHSPAHQAMTLEQVKNKVLPMSLKSVASITKAIESGDKETALKELAHLQAMLEQIQAIINKQVNSSFANTKCPIMGQPLDPKQVPDHLIRAYKGQKIGFCCAGCPEKWDGLSEAQKEAKLKQYQAPSFINTTCPIMGSAIQSQRVSPNLVRQYRGQRVAFCCPGCPAQWDKLSDAQKQSKLARVKSPVQNQHTH